MANKSNPTRIPAESKRPVPVVSGDNQKQAKQRSPEGCRKLLALGVPKALVDTFPLTPHPSGRWCKKLKTPHGWKLFYFGPLKDWQAALDRYRAEVEDLTAGRTPEKRDTDGLRLLELVNRFLHFKRGRVNSGVLSMRSWYDYHQTAERVLKFFGKEKLVDNLAQSDFESLALDYGKPNARGKTWGPVKINGEIRRVRILGKYALESGLVEKPIPFGPAFKCLDRKTLRIVRNKDRQKYGARMFTAEELHTILEACPQPMKSMVMLGINGGLNNMDVATVTLSALDLERGILDFPRGKTGIPRFIPLWSETVASIKAWLAVRPEPKNPEDAHLLFLTKQRRPWYRLGRFVEDDKGGTKIKGIDNPVSKSFRVVLDNLSINGKRNFLALRHGFRTVARGARDREAVDSLMGHVDESMAGHYLEDGLPVERLRGVTDYVRTWLFPPVEQMV
jgi:integrase